MAYKSGWYIPSKKKPFPIDNGPCMFCRKTIKENEVVYVRRFTVEMNRQYDYHSRADRYALMHSVCLALALERAPRDPFEEWEEIRERVAAGGELFE